MVEYPSIRLEETDMIIPRRPYLIRHPEQDTKFTVAFVDRRTLYLISNVYTISNLFKFKPDQSISDLVSDLVFCSRAKAIALYNEIELYYWKKSIRGI